MTDWISEFSEVAANDIKYLKLISIDKLILSINT